LKVWKSGICRKNYREVFVRLPEIYLLSKEKGELKPLREIANVWLIGAVIFFLGIAAGYWWAIGQIKGY